MKAVILHAYGDLSQLSYETDEDMPPVGDGEVRIRVRATSINPIDWKLRSGGYKDRYPLDLPEILGKDVAGEVDEVGPGVAGFLKGMRVMGLANGTYAEYTTAKADVLTAIPDALSYAEAAALPLVLTTGAQLIERGAKAQPGQRILVTGALGGVGRTAVHVAKSHGVHVIAGVRASQREEAAKLGAAEVVAIDVPEELTHLHELDTVADTVGGVPGEHARKTLRDGGLFATVVGGPNHPPERDIRVEFLSTLPDASRLSQLALDVAQGALHIPIAKVFPLAEIQAATRLAESGGAGGKVVVTID